MGNVVETIMNIEFFPFEQFPMAALLEIESACHPFPWTEAVLSGCQGQGYDFVVAALEGKPIGYYITHRVLDEATLMNICVHPNHQGKGYGGQLLQNALERLKRHSITHCFLEVRASNKGAGALYQKLGFLLIDKRKGYYRTNGEREDALVMSLQLQ